MTWIIVNDIGQIDEIKKQSHQSPCIIFKHSTTCPISSAAKMRVDDGLGLLTAKANCYFLDLLRFRTISNNIAEVFDVRHESPQVLVIKNGECIYDNSHLDITVSEIIETLKWHDK